MTQSSLEERIANAHNKMSLAAQIAPSNVERLELVRISYLDIESALRVTYRFEAGTVDEASFQNEVRAYEREHRAWEIAHAEWRDREARRMEREERNGDRKPLSNAVTRMGIGGPRKPDAPKRADYASFRAVEAQTSTGVHHASGRLFDAELAFPGRSEKRVAEFEQHHLLNDTALFPKLTATVTEEPQLATATILSAMAEPFGRNAAGSTAAGHGAEFHRKVELVRTEWVEAPTIRARYFIRAHIKVGDRSLVTEVGIVRAGARPDPHLVVAACLTDRAKVARLSAVGAVVLAGFAAMGIYVSQKASTRAFSPVVEANSAKSGPNLGPATEVPTTSPSASSVAEVQAPVAPEASPMVRTPPSLVVDEASLMTESARLELAQRLDAYSRETSHQIGVRTVESLNGESIEDFSLREAKLAGLGVKGLDNGILVVIASKDRRVRIELGTGFEKYISNARAKEIVDKEMLPAFREGNYAEGLSRGIDELTIEGRAFEVPMTHKTRTDMSQSPSS